MSERERASEANRGAEIRQGRMNAEAQNPQGFGPIRRASEANRGTEIRQGRMNAEAQNPQGFGPKWTFSLSQPLARVLPETLDADGVAYPVNGDFRVALKIFRLLDDPDIADRHKPALACGLFYPGDVPPDGMRLMLEWLSPGDKSRRRDPNAPPMDFEFDADVMYASFLQQYGIDLLRVERLHWYAFLTLLRGLGEGTALSARLYVRGRDTSKLRGKEKQSAEAAKHNAQIPRRAGEREIQRQKALNDALMNGGDLSGLV